ncbi:Dedicator of cytokinesis family protein [Histomonas meleagridis]|nr:Dedicator of cytokinesis family protein [Histomonas meleagridis]
MSQVQGTDAQLIKIYEEKGISDAFWPKHKILGTKKIENPFFDINSKTAAGKEALKEHPSITLLCDECLVYDVDPSNITIDKEYSNHRNLLFRSEIQGNGKEAPIEKDPTFLATTATISDYQLQSYNIQLNKMPPLNMHKIIVISVGDLVTSYKLIEPIVISMFMLDSTTGKIISERWNFIPDSSSRFFNNKAETNKTAAFDITNYESTAVIVAEYFRVLQTDSGDVCNAYLKKGASQSKAVASVNACWPKLKGAYSPFAFSYIQYNNIKGTRCEFPSAIIPDKLLTSDYISAYIAKPKSRADNFPINLSFNVNLLGVNKPSEIPSKYIKIPPLYPLTTQPIIEYRHQLVVNLGQSKFDFPPKVNARNIIASISLLNGSDRLKAIHSKWNEEELVYEEYSRCYYHEKAPLFDDEFVIDLPYPLGSDLMIFIKYFHASTQEKEEAFRPFAISLTKINNDMRLIDPKHYEKLRKEHRVDAASDSKTIIEKYADDILQRSRILRLSPDASAEEIQILSEYNSKNNYTSEALMCQLYQIAIITEYLTILKRMPNAYDLQHPALVFVTLFTEARSAVCPEELLEDLPYINTFCDSSIFSESGLYMVLQDIYTFCKQSRYFELSNEITRVIYPIFEKHKMFAQLGRFFQQSEISYKVIDNMSSSTDRLFGRYYRVSFYGKIFGDEDGKVYIYRETKLAHIFEVSKRIEDSYKALYGEKKIELLQISGFVDRLLLDKNKGYIQITFVEPYFEKEELPQRVTVYEQGNKLKSFKFEAPFVKGERKAQGSVDTQWLRRTILKVNQMMPSLTKRVEVPKEGIIIIEYEPIRVSIRQLKERLNAYKEALEKKDTNAIQPLLHGSLLTTVNEGPVVMAEKFLSTSLRTKYTESMRKKFNLFLEYNKKGLELYNELVKSNPKFKPLQDELEEGFKNLSDKLKPYLENKSIFGK